MNSSGGAVFALFLLLQLVTFVAMLLGGIYAIYCLHRMGENLNRLADTAERLLAGQQQNTSSSYLPSHTNTVVAPSAPQPVQYPVSQPVPPTTSSSSVDNESNI